MLPSAHRHWRIGHLIDKYGNLCYLCGEAFYDMKQISVDHVVPLSEGGADEITNLRLAHVLCNNRKASMTVEEYHAKYPRNVT